MRIKLKKISVILFFISLFIFVLKFLKISFNFPITYEAFFLIYFILFSIYLTIFADLKKIKKIFEIEQKKKLFIAYFIITSLTIACIPIIFLEQYGSPLSYKTKIKSANQSIILEKQYPIQSHVYSKYNHFGAVNIVFNNEIALEGIVNNFSVLFTLKENEGNKIIYQNVYTITSDKALTRHPFGFPIITNSINKNYIVGLEIIEFDYPVSINFDNDNNLVAEAWFNIPTKESYKYFSDAVMISKSKINDFGQNIYLHFLFISYFAILFLYKILIDQNNNYFREKVKYYCEIIAPIALLLIVTSSVNLINLSEQISYLLATMFAVSVVAIINIGSKNNSVEKTFFHINNKYYYLILGIIILSALFVRLYKIDFLPTVRDEMYHLLAGKRFAQEGSFNYSRASFLSYLLGFLFKATNLFSVAHARSIVALIGSMSVIAIYFLVKPYDKIIAIISATLLAFSPLAIGMSRYIREYEFYSFLTIAILVIFTNGRAKNTKRFCQAYFLLIIVLAIYYLFIEPTIALVLFAVLPLLFFLSEQIFVLLKNRVFLFVSVVSLLVLGGLAFYRYGRLFSLSFAEINYDYINQFFNPQWNISQGNETILHWFSTSNIHWSFLLFIFLIPLGYLFKNNSIYRSSWLFFLPVLIILTFFVDRYFAVRYAYYLLPFYVLIWAFTINFFINVSKHFKQIMAKYAYFGTLLFVTFVLFGPIGAYQGIKLEKPGFRDPKTALIRYDYPKLFDYLHDNGFSTNDILITGQGPEFQFFFNYPFINIDEKQSLGNYEYTYSKTDQKCEFLRDYGPFYYYNYKPLPSSKQDCDGLNLEKNTEEMTRMQKIISQHNSGWIIVDRHRNKDWNKNGFPLTDFFVENKAVKYLGLIGEGVGFDVYRW